MQVFARLSPVFENNFKNLAVGGVTYKCCYYFTYYRKLTDLITHGIIIQDLVSLV